jgi:rod shape-determining protein MreD
MKKCLLLLAIIILLTLQLAWPGFLIFFNCKPDLLLVFAVSLVFYLDFKTALIFGILSGLAKDMFLPVTFATNTISFSLLSYLIHILARRVSTETNYVRFAIILIASFLNNIVAGLGIIRAGNIIPLGIFLRNLIILSVYSMALSPLIFKLIKKITT